MKIRIGFVSNSSSASFVLAVREDITENEKTEIFIKHIKPTFNEVSEGMDYEDEELSDTQLKRYFFDIKNDHGVLKLDNWYVKGGEASNEGGSIESQLYYSMPAINMPRFKFITCG